MPKRIGNFSNPFTPVELQVPTVNGRPSETKQVVLVKDDEGTWVESGYVSPAYQLIKNERVSNVVDDICTRSGRTFRTLKTPYFDGRRYIDARISDETLFEVKNGLTRTAKIGIAAFNSYDGSCALKLQLFIAFVECLNQNHLANQFGSFVLRHLNGEDGANEFDVVDAARELSQGSLRLIAAAPRFQRLKDVGLDLPLLQGAKKGIVGLSDANWGKVLDRIEVDSAWGLYNALTNVASHDLDGLPSLRASNSIGEAFISDRPLAALTA